MAKATERVLRSVIAASCSTEGQIIEIKWVHHCTVTCSLGKCQDLVLPRCQRSPFIKIAPVMLPVRTEIPAWSFGSHGCTEVKACSCS